MTSQYWTGRQPVAVLLAAAIYAALSIALWRHQFVTEPVAGGVLRAFPVTELAAIICAPIVTRGLTARLPTIDLTSPRPLRRTAAAAATGSVAGFAALPLLVLVAVNLSPDLLPPGTVADVSTEDRPLSEIYTPEMALSIATAVVLVCALAFLAVAVAGPVAGPIIYLILYGALIMVQATPTGAVVASSGAGDPPYQVHPVALLLVAVAWAGSTLAWSHTCAAAAPVVLRVRTQISRQASRDALAEGHQPEPGLKLVLLHGDAHLGGDAEQRHIVGGDVQF